MKVCFSTHVSILYPVKCAWCKKTVRYSTEQHSHGICEKCKKEMLKELE